MLRFEVAKVLDENPFLPEVQAEHPEWAARMREKKSQRIIKRLAKLGPQLKADEATMRRAFNRWNKTRKVYERLEKALTKIDTEEFVAEAARAGVP